MKNPYTHNLFHVYLLDRLIKIGLLEQRKHAFFFFNEERFLGPQPKLSVYFGLLWAFLAAHGLSLAALSWGYSLVVVCGLLIVVAFLVAEPRFQGCRLQSL